MLLRETNDEEIWKSIWEYYNDKDKNVKERALETLTKIYYKNNFIHLYQLLDTEEDPGIFVSYLKSFLLTFKEMIKNDESSKTKIIYFCNRIFRSKNHENI